MEDLGKQLPQEISLIGLIQARYSEINQLVQDLRTKSPKLLSQKLPIHMRRRAASHNPKRLPAKTRRSMARVKKDSHEVSEAKERKRNRLKKYQNPKKVDLNHALREAKSDRFLLHVWFAKRFKMVKQFGYLVPHFNTTKNLRKLQRMSKNGCVHFCLSHFKCIIIHVKDARELADKFRPICRSDADWVAKFSMSGETSAFWVDLYDRKENGDSVIGPLNMTFFKANNLLLIWCQTVCHEKIIKLLTDELRGTSNEVFNGERVYQRFLLIGSESLAHLKKTLGDCGSFLPDAFEPNLVRFSPNWNFLPDSGVEVRPSDTLEDISYDHHKIFAIQMRKLDKRELIYLTVPYEESKEFWYKLVQNRTHLVGGLRDIELLCSEMKCLNYPSTGYPDLPHESNPCRSILSEILKLESANFTESNLQLLRDPKIIGKLEKLETEYIQSLFKSNPLFKTSLIYVHILCINRGTPERGDIIFLPHEADISKFIEQDKIDIKLDKIGYGPVENQEILKSGSLEKFNRRPIGVIEYGHFSMDLGVGKGFGAITLGSLENLFQLSRTKLFALIRSKRSTTYRFVQLFIGSFDNFS